MLNKDYTKEVLGLEDVIITNVENVSNQLHFYIELPRTEHVCPHCGAVTDRIHDYRMQTIKDLPLGRDTFLHLRKRRYRCACGKRFFENNNFLPRYHRATNRMALAVIQAFRKLVSAKEIGSRFNISSTTAMRYFDHFNSSPKQLPEVISLDEFKGNSGGHKYNSLLVDPKNKKILDVLPNRYENDLVQYFKQFDSRTEVKYFICDMNPHFRRVSNTCFPKAKIVADKYHVIRQSIWAMERIRKAEQKKLSDKFRKHFKRSRYLLNKPAKKLTEDEMSRLALMFEIAPRLAHAYRLKNEFIDIMRCGSSKEGRPRLAAWIKDAEAAGMSEFEDCITAYRNWFEEILNSMDVPWTNGFIEGCNNKTKVLKRVCFGMPNFTRFRKRILFCNT